MDLRFFSALGLVLSLAGCGDSETFCTLIGCTDQLTVNFTDTVGSAYTVEVVADGQSATVQCTMLASGDGSSQTSVTGDLPGSVFCAPDSLTFLFAPAQLSIDLGADDDSFTGAAQLSPSYNVSMPNGPECEPTCRGASASLTIVLSGAGGAGGG